MPVILVLSRPRRLLRALRRDRRGTAIIELALTTPIMLVAGGYGIEEANFAVTHLAVSQVALNLADNASRVGLTSSLNVTQLRESDVNDVLQGARLASGNINITKYGRITVSSLENVQQSYDSAPVQRIHWQRCAGLKSQAGYGSSYGTASPTAGIDPKQGNAGTPAPNGMGDAGREVKAPSGAGVMFVEVNYEYQPVFGDMFMGKRRIHYIASFIVRDRRDFSQLFNFSSADRQTCDLYTL